MNASTRCLLLVCVLALAGVRAAQAVISETNPNLTCGGNPNHSNVSIGVSMITFAYLDQGTHAQFPWEDVCGWLHSGGGNTTTITINGYYPNGCADEAFGNVSAKIIGDGCSYVAGPNGAVVIPTTWVYAGNQVLNHSTVYVEGGEDLDLDHIWDPNHELHVGFGSWSDNYSEPL
jgi:hypothetical protein